MNPIRDSMIFKAPTVVMVLVPQKDVTMAVTSSVEMKRWRCKAPSSMQGHSCRRPRLRLLGCIVPFSFGALDGIQGLKFWKGILDFHIRTDPKAPWVSLLAKYWNFVTRPGSVCPNTLTTMNSVPQGGQCSQPVRSCGQPFLWESAPPVRLLLNFSLNTTGFGSPDVL